MIHLLWMSLAVPVVIHLVHRRKASRVPFSTLRFFRILDRRVARRHRLKQLLLLAVRLLLLAAVIGALYQPVLRAGAAGSSRVPVAAALVLDNTYSMRAVDGGASRFERARSAALQVLEGLEQGDGACLIPFDAHGRRPGAVTTSLENMRRELERMQCGWGSAAGPDALRRAAAALAESTQPRKAIYVISDFQRLSWPPETVDVQPALPEKAPIFLLNVAQPLSKNLAVQDAQFDLSSPVVGAAGQLRCTVANTAAQQVSATIRLMLEGRAMARDEAVVEPGGLHTASLEHVFERPGPVSGQVELGPDQLDADNAFYFAMDVQERVSVLLVNGDPSSAPQDNETFYLDLALRAPGRGGQSHSPVSVRTVTPAELGDERLSDYGCVMLANVPRIPAGLARSLEAYVQGGGGLVVFLGSKTEAQNYNDSLSSILPARLKGALSSPGGAHLRRLNASHPALRGLAGEIKVERTRVNRMFDLEPLGSAVVLAAAEGFSSVAPPGGAQEAHPFLLERRTGAGACLLFASSADADWNNLPARPFFLPLLHKIVYYTSGLARSESGIVVGSRYELRLPRPQKPVTVSFYGPGSEDEPAATVSVAPDAQPCVAAFDGTARPGVYRAVWEAGGAQQTRQFAVNVDTRESKLACIEPERVAAMLGQDRAVALQSPEQARIESRRLSRGLGLWNYLFAAALALAALENWIGNGRRRGAGR
ncbi:MAG: BatA and WFA domain-containing protein [Planctomycetes bacterium]|nr:BatA and WFA domain-containing protein [Planctomycetota bacterium]